MSIYKPKKSQYWHFDFQLGGLRFSGSTETANKREAHEIEKEERGKAEQIVGETRRSGRRPLSLILACQRWWAEVGQHLAEKDIERCLGWLCDTIGKDRPLHGIMNDDVARAVAARRNHVVRAGHDSEGRQLYRPIKPRTVNRTVTLLLKRIMRRAKEAWDVAIIKEPNWKEHLLKEIKRPVREITIAEEQKIEEAERDDYRPLRRFAMITGLRLKEVLLTWPQVDFDLGVVRIVGKGKEPRVVPLSKEAYSILWAERGRHEIAVFTFVAQKTKIDPRSGLEYVRGQRYPVTYWGLSTQHVVASSRRPE